MGESLTALNDGSREDFVAAVGFAYESSPWIAERAWVAAPFADRDDLLAALRTVVDQAAPARQLELIRAHPDLATRVTLTPASTGEQASAGLDRLDPRTHARLTALNERYRERFGFPFVICVREHSVASIVAELERRLHHDRDAERATAIDEIHKIAALRLRDAVADR
jgi:OHCU decarboxylase